MYELTLFGLNLKRVSGNMIFSRSSLILNNRMLLNSDYLLYKTFRLMMPEYYAGISQPVVL